MKRNILILVATFFLIKANSQVNIYSESKKYCVEEYSINEYNIDWSYYDASISYKRCMDAKRWTAKRSNYRMKMYEGENFILIISYDRERILKINKELLFKKKWEKIK